MKRIITIFSICFLLLITTACSLGKTPTSAVERLFARYNNQDEEIVVELNDYINSSSLTDEQSQKYKELYLKQFKDMTYEIKDEKIDGDKATVTAQITVYDYYTIDKNSNDYLEKNPDKFKKDGEYDEGMFTDYKLKEMEKANQTVDYTIEFELTKTNNDWQINELTREQLEKIHGVFQY